MVTGLIISEGERSIVTWWLREVTQNLYLPSNAGISDISLPGTIFVSHKISSWIPAVGLELGRKENVKWH